MFYFNSTLNFGIPPVLAFQLEVYSKVDRILTGLTAQQKGTTAQWSSNKTSLCQTRFLLLLWTNFTLFIHVIVGISDEVKVVQCCSKNRTRYPEISQNKAYKASGLKNGYR